MSPELKKIIDLDQKNKIDTYSYLYDEFYENGCTSLEIYQYFLNDERVDISAMCFQVLSHLYPDLKELYTYAIHVFDNAKKEEEKISKVVNFIPALNLNKDQKEIVIKRLCELFENKETDSLLRAGCFKSLLELRYFLTSRDIFLINEALIVDFGNIKFEKFEKYPVCQHQ